MKIKYSKHAKERMFLRGIAIKDVEECIQKGSKELQKPDKILSYYKYFCAVYRKVGDTYYVVTVKPR